MLLHVRVLPAFNKYSDAANIATDRLIRLFADMLQEDRKLGLIPFYVSQTALFV